MFKVGKIFHRTHVVKDLGKHQRIEAQDANSFMLHIEDSFGMPMGFTDLAIPNDPR